MIELIATWKPTIISTAPTFYRAMAPLVKRAKIASLRHCVSAGEALPLSTRSMWRDASGLEMVDGIGATEMLHIFIAVEGADVRPGATGKVVPGYRACIMDEDGTLLPTDTVGRLAVNNGCCRYLADDRQLRYVQDGWNFTGDAYKMDADGYFWYQARTDDMIISAGYNIACLVEVEEALLQHPAVAECAVVGKSDADRGTIVAAVCVLRPGFASDAAMVKVLQDHVKASIAPTNIRVR